MKKNYVKKFLLIFVVLTLLFFIGCTQEQKPPDDVLEPDNHNSATDNNNTDNDNNQPEVKPAYYVNVNNFLIKPVNTEDNTKVVLLTFDDAPKGEVTYRILDTLDKYDAKAIFFVTGYYAEKNKNLIKEIYDRGHIIGNHTWNHPNLNNINNLEDTKEEITKLNDLIYEIIGEYPQYFRPPHGAISKNDYAKQILVDNNMQSMNWSLGSRDWEIVNPERYQDLIKEVTNNAFSGANILMHDIEITANALDAILSGLKEDGYSFVLPTEVILD